MQKNTLVMLYGKFKEICDKVNSKNTYHAGKQARKSEQKQQTLRALFRGFGKVASFAK